MPPVTMSQETDKDDEDQKPPRKEVRPSTSELKGGGSKKDAIDVDEIAARAEDIFILEPERLTDVYKFTGVLEFVELPNQGCAERKAIVNSWRDTEKNGYSAIHLYQLSNWFKDFRFSAMVHPPPLDLDDCKNNAERKDFWHFGLFVIDPKARSLEKKSQEHYRDRQKKFKCRAREFYVKGFIADEAMKESINAALDTKTTIMVVAKHEIGGKKTKRRKEKISIKNFDTLGGVKVISAITFRRCVENKQNNSKDKEQRRNVSCATSWLLIARHATVHPPEINGWRRQGLGLFMFICMIKHCYVVGLNDDLVNIYLQCVEAKAYNFYVTLDFKRINGKYDDGFQELPIALQKSYEVGEEKGAALLECFCICQPTHVQISPTLSVKLPNSITTPRRVMPVQSRPSSDT